MSGTPGTITALHLNSQRDNFQQSLQNEAITEHPLLNILMRKGRIEFNQNIVGYTQPIRPYFSTKALKTFGRYTTRVVEEDEVTILAKYTDGGYYDALPVSAKDLRRFKADENKLYDILKESQFNLVGRVTDRFAEQIRTGDGLAVGGEGNAIVGLNSALVTAASTNVYAQIPFLGNESWWMNAANDADLGPSLDFDLDRYERASKTIQDATLYMDGKDEEPDIGFCKRDLIRRYRNEWYSKNSPAINNSGVNIHFGAKPNIMWIDGVPIFGDNKVRTNTLEILNTNSMKLKFADAMMWVIETIKETQKVASPLVIELTTLPMLVVTRPRLNGLLFNANA